MAKAFEPFLKTMRELEEENAPNTPPTNDNAAIKDTSVVLAVLTRNGPTKLGELQALTGLGFAPFSDAVRSLLAARVIELEGPSGDEIARLAPSVAAIATD
jgi:hypothetical protein